MSADWPQSPTPETIRAARANARMTQASAAALVYRSTARRWQEWEYGERGMDPTLFEYWLILAGLAHDRESARTYWASL